MAIKQSESGGRPGRKTVRGSADGGRTSAAAGPAGADRTEPAAMETAEETDKAGADAAGPGDRVAAETGVQVAETGDLDGDEGRASNLLSRALPYLAYVAAAVYLLNGLWRDPGGRMLQDNYQDQVFFEWLLTNGANVLANGDNPLFSTKINAPYGLNLMANTSVLALALP